MEEFTVKLNALTPIWTGDADRKCNDLKESGIIGSLRWWYEVLLRGLGFNACDPTNESLRCKLDQKKFYEAINSGKSVLDALNDQNICQACQLFGCSGWARKFRLEINHFDNQNYAPFLIAKPPNSKKPYFLGYYDKSGKDYKKNGGLLGKYKLKFFVESIGEIKEESIIDILKMLILLSSHWGLGSGTQKGFGIVEVEENLKFNNTEFFNKEKLSKNNNHIKNQKQNLYKLPLPKIDQFFFYKIPFKTEAINNIMENILKNIYKTTKDLNNNNNNDDYKVLFNSFIPTSPWIRQSIRTLFRENFESTELRHYIMGFINGNIHLECWKDSIKKNEKKENYCTNCKKEKIDEKDILTKTGSKIYVSHIYNKNAFEKDQEPFWEMKIWGWIPEIDKNLGKSRDEVANLLKKNLEGEKFWKNALNLDNFPVEITKIVEKWDLKPEVFFSSGSRCQYRVASNRRKEGEIYE